jgi:hypothetical protein
LEIVERSHRHHAVGGIIRTPRRTCDRGVFFLRERTIAIATSGEFFPDGHVIEPVRAISNVQELALLVWDGKRVTIALRAELDGRTYLPARMDPTILRELRFPKTSAPYGSAKQLLSEMSALVTEYTGLSENFVVAVSRFALCSWFASVLPTAPWLSIVGKNVVLGDQLLRLLRGLCRHALPVTDVNAAGVYSLPFELGLTLLIQQPELDGQVARLLLAARKRDACIPRGGRLLRAHAPIATYAESSPDFGGGMLAAIEIPATPTSSYLPLLDPEAECRIADEFQPKLLGYMLENHQQVADSKLDWPMLSSSIRELGRSLASCTPGDTDLQTQVIHFLKAQDESERAARCSDVDVVLIEALLFLCHEGHACAYVGEVEVAAQTILLQRGENVVLTPKAVAAKMRRFGLVIEARDSRGYRVLLTQGACRRVHELAVGYDVPAVQDGVVRCPQCDHKEAQDPAEDGTETPGGA